MLAAAAVVVAAAEIQRTAEGQVTVRACADVDLTRHVQALVGRVVEVTGLIQVSSLGEGSSLIGAGTHTREGQRTRGDGVHPIVGGTIVTHGRGAAVFVTVDIESKEESEEGFLVASLQEGTLQATAQAAVAITVD